MWQAYYDGFCSGEGRLRFYVPKMKLKGSEFSFMRSGTYSFLLDWAFELVEPAKFAVEAASLKGTFKVDNPSLRIFRVGGSGNAAPSSELKQCDCDVKILLRTGCKCGGK